MKRIYYILVFVAMLVAPISAEAQHIEPDHYRKALVMLGFETPETKQALRTLGMDDAAIENYFEEMAYWTGKLSAGYPVPFVNESVPPIPMFTIFNLESCWTFTTTCVRSDIEMENAIYNTKKSTLDDLVNCVLIIRNLLLSKHLRILEMQKGEEVFFNGDLPSDTYCEKLERLLYRTGEFDKLYDNTMAMVTQDLGLEDYGDLHDYFYAGDYIFRTACVYNRFLTESDIDELCDLYDSAPGKRLKELGEERNRLLDAINRGDSNGSTKLPQTEEDIKALFALNNPTMRKYQAACIVLGYCNDRIAIADLEDIYEMTPGTVVRIYNGPDPKDYIEFVDYALERFCNGFK